jgi:hypothetical protein
MDEPEPNFDITPSKQVVKNKPRNKKQALIESGINFLDDCETR